MKIRWRISQILEIGIAEDKWEEVFAQLEREGRITNRHVHKILIELLKREEEREHEKD